MELVRILEWETVPNKRSRSSDYKERKSQTTTERPALQPDSLEVDRAWAFPSCMKLIIIIAMITFASYVIENHNDYITDVIVTTLTHTYTHTLVVCLSTNDKWACLVGLQYCYMIILTSNTPASNKQSSF